MHSRMHARTHAHAHAHASPLLAGLKLPATQASPEALEPTLLQKAAELLGRALDMAAGRPVVQEAAAAKPGDKKGAKPAAKPVSPKGKKPPATPDINVATPSTADKRK